MLDLTHGGHVLPEDAPGAREAANRTGDALATGPPPAGTPFDYLLPQLKSRPQSRIPGDPAKVTTDLKALGAAMVGDGAAVLGGSDDTTRRNSYIPVIYTYWGQFIDHDMTANTDRDSATSDITRTPLIPLDPGYVAQNLRNLRRPTFDLDNLYGNGPGFDDADFRPDPGPADRGFYDGARFRLGENTVDPRFPGAKIPPESDLHRDVPRIGPLLKQGVITEHDIPASLRLANQRDTRAFIGDLRNDENLIVAQLHVAFMRFHNKVVKEVQSDPETFGFRPVGGPPHLFQVAQRLVRLHYQWLVVNDYLPTVTLPGVVDKILLAGNKHYRPLADGQLFAPLEYSVAAFRFGHSMVRKEYDLNRNFGRRTPPGREIIEFAYLFELFRFTGNGHAVAAEDLSKSTPDALGGAPTLPSEWIAEWDRLTNKTHDDELHFARKVDTHLSEFISNMVNEGNAAGIQDDDDPAAKPLRQMLRSVAQRNLLRGYLLGIPTGQAVAEAMGVHPLSENELRQGNRAPVNVILEKGGFLTHTPLWFYILKEAEIRAHGNTLGELGSRIVAETQIGLMRNDAGSYMNVSGGWDPSKGVRLKNGDPIVTIRDFLAYADLIT